MRPVLIGTTSALILFALAGCERNAGAPTGADGAAAGGKTYQIAMIPKKVGLAYFAACQKGGEEAAKELGDVEFVFNGPTDAVSELQSSLLQTFVTRQFDAVTVACNDPNQIAPAMASARDAGTHILTFDADADPQKSKREFFVNQATVEAIARTLVDEMVSQTSPTATVGVVSSDPEAPNQVAWLKAMEEHRKANYPGFAILPPEYGGESQQLSMEKAQGILNSRPDISGIFGITSVAFPAVAQAVERAGKSGKVAVVGLSTPKEMRRFVHSGTVKTVILWNPVDLGYLTVWAARDVAKGDLKPGATSIRAGRLGEKQIVGSEILLGDPMKFTKENIDQYDF